MSSRSVIPLAFVLASFWNATLQGQVPATAADTSIPSLVEPSEGLVIRSVSPRSGHATFASSTGKGILLPLPPGTSAEARALSFVDTYGEAFGIARGSQMKLLRTPEVDELGVEHVRLQQMHQGVPIRAAELVVHLAGSRVIAANGHTIDDFSDDVTPDVPPALAQSLARGVIEKHRATRASGSLYSEPRLEIFNRALLSDGVEYRSRLAWFVEATGPALREYIWIDARSGVILLHFSQFAEAKSRQVYNSQHTSALGTLVRSEGGPATGDADQDNAYTYAGITYDYYLNNHARDSFDNAGAVMVSSTHFCAEGYPQGSTCPTYQNAAWTGTRMVYADGFASADDVVGHELTHAVTDTTSGLLYYVQSGALNESFSDIFGEVIDLTDGAGNDASNVRWRIGEDLPVGAIRDMMTPTVFNDPGKLSDSSYFVCNANAWTDDEGDAGGVHTNSGVPNHAFALMVDGGTYNNTVITGIGLTKAAKIQYRALTAYLTSGSGFLDDYNALNQSCTDLVGTVGITTTDCAQVTKALQAVEMNNPWPCSGRTQAPPLCSTGMAVNTFLDTFETTPSNWTATNGAGVWASHDFGFAKGGTYMAFGDDPNAVSDHRLAMTSAVTIPTGARLYFDHAFEFEDSFDGGVVEYSVNGTNWIDAGSLIDAGQSPNGFIVTGYGNPLAGRSGFVGSTHGYTGTRLNLASLAGQNARFRFRIGSDSSVSSLGWAVDNVAIYTCAALPSGTIAVVDSIGNLGTVNPSTETSTVTGYTGVVLTDVARTSSSAMWGIDFNNLYSINPVTAARTLIGSLGVGGMNALVANGTGLLAASISTTSLYTVNTSTGAATPLSGSLGFPSMGDLAFHGGNLYAAVKNGSFSDLVRVNLSGGSFSATNLGHVTSDNELFALAEGADHNLYGLAGTRVLRIDTSNPAGSTVVVFNYGLNGLNTANGAASPVTAAFTNDPLFQFSNIIRAVHITELRTRIGAIRTAAGLGSYGWTDPTLTATSTLIKAAHVTDLRTALTQAYVAAGWGAPVFSDTSLVGTLVKALHLTQLRNAVTAIE